MFYCRVDAVRSQEIKVMTTKQGMIKTIIMPNLEHLIIKRKDEMNKLRITIEKALKDIHIETGTKDDFVKVVNKIEIEVSKMVLSQDIDIHSEGGKDFSKYELFE